MSSFATGFRAFTPPLSAQASDLAPESGSPGAFRLFSDARESSVMHRFVVTVETGNNNWAGTDEKVHVQLFGDRGITPEILLREDHDMRTQLRYITPRTPDEKHTLFSKGSVREFSFMAVFVGNLVKIRVAHDGGDDFQRAWRLERIVVRDEQLQRSWSFACKIWLNRDQGNVVELAPTGDVAAGRRASIRLSRKRSNRRLGAASADSEPGSGAGAAPFGGGVAAMLSKFSGDPPAPGTASSSEGGVRRVCFQLTKYDDEQGHMYLFGAIPALGAWDTTRAHRMGMHLGADGTWRGEWRLELEIDDDFDVIEYKYMQVDEVNDKVYFSESALVLKLSDGSDSTNRKVEGGVIYVRDSFGDDTVKTPFCNTSTDARGEPAESCEPEVPATPEQLSAPTPPRAIKRNSLGFLGRGGSAFLVSEEDSAMLANTESPESDLSSSAREAPDVQRALDDEYCLELGALDPGPQADGTAKLKSELDVTRSLLAESKREMMQKDAELSVLQDRLHSATVSASISSSMLQQVQREGERSSPVSSEYIAEEDASEAAALRSDHAEEEPVVEDSKSESPEGTDSDYSRDEASVPVLNETIVPVLTTLPVLGPRRESRMTAPRPSLRSLRSPSTTSSVASPLAATSPLAQRRYAQRLISAEKVRKAATKVQQEVLDVRQDLEELRAVMAEQTQVFEARQAELVRLVMDASELRIAEKNAMIKEKDVLYASWAREFKSRRELFNTIQELKGNIRVFCRVRPLKISKGKDGKPAPMAVSFPNVNIGDPNCIQANSKNFEFSHVFGPEASQEKVYDETSGVIGSVLDGYNVCVFAYGQTGSGKTHTMNGPKNDRGVNFRALTDLFKMAEERSDLGKVNVRVSMIEIYNESLKDLIFESSPDCPKPPKLDIRKDGSSSSKTAVYIPSLTEVEVSSVDDVWRVMEKGAHNRAMESTSMNEHSSRSHLILRVQVEIENERSGSKLSGVLSLVDLAGSERVGRSHATGDRLREAQHINKSLATLGDVFKALLSKSPHIPYRNSKLTYLLQDSLGGDSKTLMFVNVSCDEADLGETTSSLLFAQRVSQIELGTAQRHSESLAATKATASLNEKRAENLALKSQVAALQREMKKKDTLVDEQKQKLKHIENALKENKQALEEKKKREMSERGGAMRELRDLKAHDEKRQTEMRNTKLKAREVAKAKDDEIRRLQHQVDERDKKIAALEALERRSRGSSSNSNGTSGGTSSTQSLPRPNVTRQRLPRGATVASGIGARGRSVRFGPPSTPDQSSDTGAPTGRATGECTGDTAPTNRRASSRAGTAGLEANTTRGRADAVDDSQADAHAGGRRATVAPGQAPAPGGISNRRGSMRIGEPRRVSSAPAVPRANTSVGPPSRLNRTNPTGTSGKRVTYAFGTRVQSDLTDNASTGSGRPTRPPRSSAMRKPPLRNVGLAARNASGPGVRRANTFTSASGANRNRANRPALKPDPKSAVKAEGTEESETVTNAQSVDS